MANGLMGLSNLLGQSSSAQSGGLMGGGVFSQPESRGQRRSRLLTDAIANAGQNPYARLGASFGGLIGLGGRAAAEGLGIVDAPAEVQRNQAISQVQQEVQQRGLDPMANPAEFGEFVSSRFQELGQPELATRTQMQIQQMMPEPQQPPAAFQNLALRARAAGLEPGTREYAEFFRTGGREPDAGTNVTIQGDTGPQVGTIPQGFQLEEVDGSYRLSPIPGGPADLEAQQAEEQAEGREELQQRAGQVVFEDIERLENLVSNDSILDPVLGVKGVVASQIPGTKRVDAESLAQTVRANIGFDRLQQMREASPTGGALGQVSNQELDTLQSVLGSLSFSQSQDQLLQNLDRLKQIYSVILTKAQAYPNANDFGFGESSAPAGAAAEGLGNGEGGSPTVDWSDM